MTGPAPRPKSVRADCNVASLWREAPRVGVNPVPGKEPSGPSVLWLLWCVLPECAAQNPRMRSPVAGGGAVRSVDGKVTVRVAERRRVPGDHLHTDD